MSHTLTECKMGQSMKGKCQNDHFHKYTSSLTLQFSFASDPKP